MAGHPPPPTPLESCISLLNAVAPPAESEQGAVPASEDGKRRVYLVTFPHPTVPGDCECTGGGLTVVCSVEGGCKSKSLQNMTVFTTVT